MRIMELSYFQVVFVISYSFICCNGVSMEPSCSSFEFEKKMLENTVRLEYEYKLSNKKVNDDLISLAAEKEQFMKKITEAHENLITDVSEKRKEMDAVFENQQATIQRLSHDLQEMKNETMKELIDKSHKSDISFRASSSAYMTVSPGTTIVFPVVSLNHGNGYDPSTGHFTAPVNGTYMFIVRVCPQYKKDMIINIVVDNEVYAWSRNNDDHTHNCYSYSDVIDLVKGMEVWIKCGSGCLSSFSVYHDTTYYQNIFSGYFL